MSDENPTPIAGAAAEAIPSNRMIRIPSTISLISFSEDSRAKVRSASIPWVLASLSMPKATSSLTATWSKKLIVSA